MVDHIRAMSRFLPREYGPIIDIKQMIRHGVMIYGLGPDATRAERRRHMKTVKNMYVHVFFRYLCANHRMYAPFLAPWRSLNGMSSASRISCPPNLS